MTPIIILSAAVIILSISTIMLTLAVKKMRYVINLLVAGKTLSRVGNGITRRQIIHLRKDIHELRKKTDYLEEMLNESKD